MCIPRVDGNGGIPAGCQAEKDGSLWVADMRLGILKVNPQDGTFTQIAKLDRDGATMQGCNDCSLDYLGNLWVTAPAGKIAPHPYRRSFEVSCNMKIRSGKKGFLFPRVHLSETYTSSSI